MEVSNNNNNNNNINYSFNFFLFIKSRAPLKQNRMNAVNLSIVFGC